LRSIVLKRVFLGVGVAIGVGVLAPLAWVILVHTGVIYFGKTITVVNDLKISVSIDCAGDGSIKPGEAVSIRLGENGANCGAVGPGFPVDVCADVDEFKNGERITYSTFVKYACP
jgi:hypothetical protein